GIGSCSVIKPGRPCVGDRANCSCGAWSMRQPQAGESAAAVPAVGGCMRRLSGGYGGCWMRDCCFPVPQRIKPPGSIERGGFKNKSLTMTYFHTGCSTIIGAKSFHGPVRDGKG